METTRMHLSSPRARRLAAGATAVALGATIAAAAALGAAPANAASADVTDASLSWSLSNEANAGAYFGGCNFLSAGVAGNSGASAPWTATNPSPGYAASAGNVSIAYPKAAGGTSTPTFATKCQTGDGTTVRPGTTTAGVLTLAAGTGTVDAAAGTADIAWDGGFTVAFYGGLTYWSAEDPELHVAADGTGELTATVSGYAASRDGGSWAPLTPRTVHLATLTDVDVTSSGITVSPDWQGVEPASATSLNKTNADWGSWPADFVDFQNETGQSSYWYTSGANDAAAKKPQPISIAYTAAEAPTPEPTEPSEPGTPEPTTEPSEPGTPEPTTEPSEPGTPEPTTEPSEPGTPEPTTGPTTGPTTEPTTAPTTPAPSISTGGTTTFTVGDSVPLRAEGLPAATEYSIVLHSDPVVLGTVTTDADGAFATSVVIPTGTPAGAHTIAVESSDGTAVVSLAITVTADGTVVVDPIDTTTAVTTGAAVNTGGTVSGTSALPWIGLSAVGVVALGSVAFIAYRRRVAQQD
ncbi:MULTISPECIES: hypothetical protein [unclassified Curtobacterium]|uniref:hypothetical protein n=1 Tax=unclassified Curtobacterium TaxID=257496 RepID=UPI0010627ECE|nr:MULTISPECIES: hypothetical protein [unclassified Curtobacterium]